MQDSLIQKLRFRHESIKKGRTEVCVSLYIESTLRAAEGRSHLPCQSIDQSDPDMEHQTLGDPMQGAGLPARPGLVAASDAGSGSSLRATPAPAPRQRKPGRWRRIPRDKLTWPIPTSNSLIPPEALSLSGTADFVPPGFRAFLPMRDPRDPGKTTKQVPLNTFELVVVAKGSKVISPFPLLGIMSLCQ